MIDQAGLIETFESRRRQLRMRLILSVLITLGYGGLVGWHIAAVWLAIYLALQFFEFRLEVKAPEGGRLEPWRVRAALGVLLANGVVFGGFAIISELKQALDQAGKTGYWQKRLEILVRTGRADARDSVGRMRLIYGQAATGEIEKAMPLLEKAITEGNQDALAYVKVDPRFDNLRSHPRFTELLRRMNLSN